MANKPTMFRFRSIVKGGRKGSKYGQHKKVRVGARHPGAQKQGSIRKPY